MRADSDVGKADRHRQARDFHLAEGGFIHLQALVARELREGREVASVLEAVQAQGWTAVEFDGIRVGWFRLVAKTIALDPFSIRLAVEGLSRMEDTAKLGKFEAVDGVLKLPGLARYGRNFEDDGTLQVAPGHCGPGPNCHDTVDAPRLRGRDDSTAMVSGPPGFPAPRGSLNHAIRITGSKRRAF